MSNETQIPPSEPQTREENGGQAANGNGFDSVAAQYRAMQEAQLLHEETINQLREEIRGQREKLAEIAKSAPAARSPQVDMVMLRLSELERKIGEGAPDPLINEIAHRLAALENNGPLRGAKDPRVDELNKQLEQLRQQVAQSSSSDPRTDDVVLRIASLEAAFRRAAQSRDPEEVQARIDAIAEELGSKQDAELAELRAGLAEAAKLAAEAKSQEPDPAASQALSELTERLAKVEQQLADDSASQSLSAFGRQLEELERKLSDHAHDNVEQRVASLEERVASQPDSGLEEVAERIDLLEEKLRETGESATQEQLRQLEAKLATLDASPKLETLEQRIEELASRSEVPEVSGRLLDLAGRVRALESAKTETPAGVDPAELELLRQRLEKLEQAESQDAAPAGADPAELELLRQRLEKLEQTESQDAALAEISRVEKELRALQAVSRTTEEPSTELISRLEELENRVSDAESSTRLEDAQARLEAIENKWSVLGEPAELGRRLTILEMNGQQAADPRVEELIQKLSALESRPASSIEDERLQQLGQTVDQLRAELQSVSNSRPNLPADLPDRLARLESQVAEAAANQPAAEPEQIVAVSELRTQLQSLGGRIEELSARPVSSSNDPRVSELIARIEWIERSTAEAPASSGVDVTALTERLEALEKTIAEREQSGSNEGLSSGAKAEIFARFSAIEEAIAAQQNQQGPQGQGGADVEGLLHKESERWNQWARSTIDEIGELRERIDSLDAPSAGLDAESVEALGIQISHGLNSSEVKALRAQMYFVYLSLGMLFAIVLYVLFAG